MNLKIQLLFALSVLLSVQTVVAEGIVVIVNEKNAQKLTNNEIKAIYSDNITQWDDGGMIKSFGLPVESKAREKFSREILGMSAMDAELLWANRKITNSAKNPPSIKKERLIVLSVKRYKNAIGYVRESSITDEKGLRVVTRIP